MIKIKTNDGWKLVSGFNGTSDVIGSVIAFAGSTAPDGYFICDGRAVSRTIYSKLFAVIGTTYGPGDGSTTFNIPDLRDKFIEGSGTDAVGTAKTAGLPEISGTWKTKNFWNNYRTVEQVTGAITYAATTTTPTVWGYEYKNDSALTVYDSTMYFNASNSNPIYGNSTTVQPPAMTMIYIIKWRDNVSGTAATPDGTSIITDENQVMSVNPQKFLATTGGTMTGAIVSNVGNSPFIKNQSNDNQLNINAGTDWTTGAHITMYGKDEASSAGNFIIAANNGTSVYRLTGTPTGSLTWNNRTVATTTSTTPTITYRSGWANVITEIFNISGDYYYVYITVRNDTGSAQGAGDLPIADINGNPWDMALATSCYEALGKSIMCVIQTKILKLRSQASAIPAGGYVCIGGIMKWNA